MSDAEEVQRFQVAMAKISRRVGPDGDRIDPGDEVICVVRCEAVGPAGDGTLGLLPVAFESIVKG